MASWYSEWFNTLYLKLYSHRDATEAGQQVAFLLEKFKVNRMLDVACGTGRHVAAFRQRGVEAYGIDRSKDLLQHAREQLEGNAQLCCADMRQLPFADASFDLVTSFFTSFGYFETDEEHQRLLSEWVRVVRPRGYLFIDYLNPQYVQDNLVPESKRQEGSLQITERRRINERNSRVIKDISIVDLTDSRQVQYQESVRLYSLEEMQQLLGKAGMTVDTVYGDFEARPFSSTSLRMLLLSRPSAA